MSGREATNADHGQVATISGARVVSISVEAAEAFLARVNERAPDETSFAVAAVLDDGPMIGVGVLGSSATDDGRVMIAVATERRRLHIGTDLLHALATHAHQLGLRHLRISYKTDATVTDAFVNGCGLRATRRVVNNTVTAVLAVRD